MNRPIPAPMTQPLGLRVCAVVALLVATLSGCGGGGSSEPTVVQHPDMSVSLQAKPSDQLAGGTSFSYSYIIQNKGNATASNVELIAQTAPFIEDVRLSCEPSGSAAPSCPTDQGQRMTIKNWAPGVSLTVSLRGTVRRGASGAATAALEAHADGDATANEKRAEHRFQAWSSDLVLVGQGPSSRVAEGGSFAFVLDLSNAGPDTARHARLDTQLVTAADRSPTPGTRTCVASGGAVCPANLESATLDDLELPKGGRLIITLPYQFAPGVSSGLVFSAGTKVDGDSNTTNNYYLTVAR